MNGKTNLIALGLVVCHMAIAAPHCAQAAAPWDGVERKDHTHKNCFYTGKSETVDHIQIPTVIFPCIYRLVTLTSAIHSNNSPDVSPFKLNGTSESVSIGIFSNDVAKPRSILIIIHGHSRDALRTFYAGLTATKRIIGHRKNILVVAPLFKVVNEELCQDDSDHVITTKNINEPKYSCSSWGSGVLSKAGPHLTSFALMDNFISYLISQYPKIPITLAGFSEGGQFVQRYSAFVESRVARVIVGAPGSYLRFDAFPPNPACDILNDYKYGVKPGHTPLPAPISVAELKDHYRKAPLFYVWGAKDVKKNSHLDTSCAANAQGKNRAERGMNYYLYDKTQLMNKNHQILTPPQQCHHDVNCVFPAIAQDLFP